MKGICGNLIFLELCQKDNDILHNTLTFIKDTSYAVVLVITFNYHLIQKYHKWISVILFSFNSGVRAPAFSTLFI